MKLPNFSKQTAVLASVLGVLATLFSGDMVAMLQPIIALFAPSAAVTIALLAPKIVVGCTFLVVLLSKGLADDDHDGVPDALEVLFPKKPASDPPKE